MSNRPRIPWLAGLLALVALAAQPARAGHDAQEARQLLQLSLQDLIATPMITASRQSETRDQTPAHVMVFTRAQIRERRYQNLADLLEDLPGVDFQRGTKSSQYNQFAVQGYVGPGKLLVLLDGVRIGHPGGGNFPVADNLDLHMARQVEVLYGPAAALYGADAVAGVVNIITEHGGQQAGSWASAGAGRFGARRGSFMTGTTTEGGLGLSFGGHWQQADRAPLQDYYPTYFPKVDGVYEGAMVLPAATREDYTGAMGSASLFGRIDLADRLTLGWYRYRFHSLTSTGDPPATARYDSGAQWRTTSDTVYANWHQDWGGGLRGELTLDHSRLEVDPRAYYDNVFNGFARGYSYVLGERTGIEQSLHWRLSDAHQLQLGLGWQTIQDIEASSLPSPYDTGRAPGDQGMVFPNTGLPLPTQQAHFHNLSAYGQWQARWSARWSSMAGLRLDRHSAYGSALNPRVGAVYKPGERHVLKALYGQAFRAPSPDESLNVFGRFDGSQDGAGNYWGHNFRVPSLRLNPEKASTLSLVWDWRATEALNLTANLYHSRIKDLIVKAQLGDIVADGAHLIAPETRVNAGQQRQSGLDLAGQWRFRLSPDWSGDLWGSVSWIHGRVDEDGVQREIPYVARHKLKLGATLRWRDSVSITPRLRLASATTNGRVAPPDAALQIPAACVGTPQAPQRCRTPGGGVLDLHLGWHHLLGGKATLWLDVYNVTDRRWLAAGGAGSRTFWDMPQQPRSWMLTLDWRL